MRLKLTDREKQITMWHKWFAWHPVIVELKNEKYITWLETIGRMGEIYRNGYARSIVWKYVFIQKGENND
jgi:hypothetical protein